MNGHTNESTNSRPKVIGYTRVSTQKQVQEGEGLEIQRDRIIEFCDRNGYDLIWDHDCDDYKIFSDEGISGSKESVDRPAIMEMIAYCKTHSIDYVIADKVDRLSRNVYQLMDMEDQLKKCDVEVMYAKDDILNGNGPRIKFLRTIMAAVAELERSMIIERLSDGMKKKANNGNKPVGRQPFGYEYNYSDNNKTTIVNMAQAKVVKEIFTMRHNGTTLDQIANILNSPEHRNENINAYTGNNTNRVWTNQSVRFVLMNDYYIGKVTHGGEKTDGNHPAIVDIDLWEAVAVKVAS